MLKRITYPVIHICFNGKRIVHEYHDLEKAQKDIAVANEHGQRALVVVEGGKK